MAVPSLPTGLNTGDVVDNAWVDAVRDMFSWFRNDLPIFRMTYEEAVPTSTFTEIGLSDGSGNFGATPDINQGGWTAETGGNDGIVFPEDGKYVVTFEVRSEVSTASSNQYRVQWKHSGNYVEGLRLQYYEHIANITNPWRLGLSTIIDSVSANDTLDCEIWHDSGSTDDFQVTVCAWWLNS